MKKSCAGPLVLSLLLCASTLAIADESTIQVSTTEATKAAVTKVEPDYPPVAKQLGIRGDMIVKAVIGDPERWSR